MSHVKPSILLLLTTATIGTVASAEEGRMSSVAEGNSQFAVDLYGKLRNQPGNLFFSPSSISTALAMTYAGARGETADQMARVLHFPSPQDKLPEGFRWLHAALRPVAEKPGYRLNVANRLWGQQGYHFLPDFLAVTRDSFHAELAEVDFIGNTELARETINEWVEKETQDKIKDLVTRGAHAPEQAGLDQRDLLQGRLDQAVPQGRDPGRDLSRLQRQDHDRAPDAQDRRLQVCGC